VALWLVPWGPMVTGAVKGEVTGGLAVIDDLEEPFHPLGLALNTYTCIQKSTYIITLPTLCNIVFWCAMIVDVKVSIHYRKIVSFDRFVF
jgi:hypothetical protein